MTNKYSFFFLIPLSIILSPSHHQKQHTPFYYPTCHHRLPPPPTHPLKSPTLTFTQHHLLQTELIQPTRHLHL
ncbi:DUF3255 family protein, partial [Bacillus subtilis]|uniref:DUF3255 family protein n=1 Tax=Bacillus subtilis TaxID=1423 RepID=UPI00338F8940